MRQRLQARVRFEAERVKGSLFIGTAAPISNEDEARELLASVEAEWPDASHHCWAWRISSPAIDRASDDGEPSGSAGRPMLAMLTGRDLVDTAVIVSRWFGGTKLGVGGLVRAYGSTAAATLDAGTFEPWVDRVPVTIVHGPGDTAAVERALSSVTVVPGEVDWGQQVTRQILVAATDLTALSQALADATQGRVLVTD